MKIAWWMSLIGRDTQLRRLFGATISSWCINKKSPVVSDHGILNGSPYNRWGILGGFVVTRFSSNGSYLSLTDKQIQQVLSDLGDADDGYLNPACNVLNSFREPFAIHGIPASGWMPSDGKWFG